MKKTFVALFLTVVMALAMVGGALAEDAAAVKIGVIGPMTGAAASYGVSVAQGAELAASEVNALGGIQIELNIQDDQHDPETSINAYNALWDWGAQMILGTVTTGPCIAVAPRPTMTACSCSHRRPPPRTLLPTRTMCISCASPTR